MRRLTAIVLTLTLAFSAMPSFAASADGTNQASAQGPRRQLGYIVMAGLAGAILGLSTLSFYGRPQDRLSNIAVGFAIGVIGGATYTTYKAATEPKDFYNYQNLDPEAWRAQEIAQMRERLPTAPNTAFTFEF